ncbi:MAG: hypothetical protein H7Z74_08845 [Anaerolineae bacterium]|nr:hypothetical protein [Gemmatimonadaceae bacterium]
MNREDMDGDLRERFARLREDERVRAGSFLRVRTRSSRALDRGWTASMRVVMAAAAVIAFAFVTVTRVSDRRGTASVVPGAVTAMSALPIGSWDAPTDFLLKTPGAQLLNTLPSIGRTRGWGLTGDAEGARPVGPDSQGRTPS